MTPRQRQTLDFIAAYTLANRYSPTYAEIAAFMGMSIFSVNRKLRTLELLGYISRSGKTRGLAILRMPA